MKLTRRARVRIECAAASVLHDCDMALETELALAADAPIPMILDAARAHAILQGWVVVAGHCYCPDHTHTADMQRYSREQSERWRTLTIGDLLQ